jgi:hypothetical protein
MILDSMGDNMNVFDRAIRHQQSIFIIEVRPVDGCAVYRLLHESTIFRMNALKNHVEGDEPLFVVSKNSEALLRPEDSAAGDVPAEAAGLA